MRNLVLAIVCLGLLACKAATPRHPNEYLDSVTAAMVSSVTAPIIFARAHPDVAADKGDEAWVAAEPVGEGGQLGVAPSDEERITKQRHADSFLLAALANMDPARLPDAARLRA